MPVIASGTKANHVSPCLLSWYKISIYLYLYENLCSKTIITYFFFETIFNASFHIWQTEKEHNKEEMNKHIIYQGNHVIYQLHKKMVLWTFRQNV